MLVLSRQADETVVLDFAEMTDAQLLALRDTPLELMIASIRGDKVRIGFDGPRAIQIHRKEVHDQIVRRRREERREEQAKKAAEAASGAKKTHV